MHLQELQEDEKETESRHGNACGQIIYYFSIIFLLQIILLA